jgi:hypothetical protein
LAIDSPWFGEWTKNLKDAAATCFGEDPTSVIEEGLTALEHHRLNHTATRPDPKHLQSLWWEFPPEHWDALRHGSLMNVLMEPPHGMHDNAPMDAAQLVIACKFVDELIALGALIPEDPNDPVFLLPKPGQPGQWRILADLRAGRQNSVAGPNPTVSEECPHPCPNAHSRLLGRRGRIQVFPPIPSTERGSEMSWMHPSQDGRMASSL